MTYHFENQCHFEVYYIHLRHRNKSLIKKTRGEICQKTAVCNRAWLCLYRKSKEARRVKEIPSLEQRLPLETKKCLVFVADWVGGWVGIDLFSCWNKKTIL